MTYLLKECSKFALLLFLVLNACYVQGQITFSKSQRFVFQVKQVDEFIERFNGEKNTVLQEFLRKYHAGEKMERYELISTLFNHEDSTWDLDLVKEFLADILDPERPKYLDYYDRDWYAELECEVEYQGVSQTLHLFLELESNPDLATEWVIRGIKADFLCLPEVEDPKNMLNPVSHATDFMNLYKLFEQPKFARGYMHKNFRGDLLTLFYHEVSQEKLKLLEIKHINYHFLQIRDWTFVVSQYRRSGLNSGWLIKSLTPMKEAEKIQYRLHKLFLD